MLYLSFENILNLVSETPKNNFLVSEILKHFSIKFVDVCCTDLSQCWVVESSKHSSLLSGQPGYYIVPSSTHHGRPARFKGTPPPASRPWPAPPPTEPWSFLSLLAMSNNKKCCKHPAHCDKSLVDTGRLLTVDLFICWHYWISS